MNTCWITYFHMIRSDWITGYALWYILEFRSIPGLQSAESQLQNGSWWTVGGSELLFSPVLGLWWSTQTGGLACFNMETNVDLESRARQPIYTYLPYSPRLLPQRMNRVTTKALGGRDDCRARWFDLQIFFQMGKPPGHMGDSLIYRASKWSIMVYG